MNRFILKNPFIVNEGKIFKGTVLVEKDTILSIIPHESGDKVKLPENFTIIPAEGMYLLPGMIDSHVHFREPGLTWKGDIFSESSAAIAGGVTTFFDMPNTIPPTLFNQDLEEKFRIASHRSISNYSFFIGADEKNINDLINKKIMNCCGIKIFMGSSTGNMVLSKMNLLEKIFEQSPYSISTHCEDDEIIKKNEKYWLSQKEIPFNIHSIIRNEKACFDSSMLAVKLAQKYNSYLTIKHLSTAEEIDLLTKGNDFNAKKITSEVCVHHLWFDEEDYHSLGNKIKCNPSIKNNRHKLKLMEGVLEDKIDIISTDHAPHTLDEKMKNYFSAPGGLPLIQFSLNAMLEFYLNKTITLEKIVEKMCHNPALIYKIKNRGFIREGYKADLVLIDFNKTTTVNRNSILSRCAWSPFDGVEFRSAIDKTFVNGNLVYNGNQVNSSILGERVDFEN